MQAGDFIRILYMNIDDRIAAFDLLSPTSLQSIRI